MRPTSADANTENAGFAAMMSPSASSPTTSSTQSSANVMTKMNTITCTVCFNADSTMPFHVLSWL